MEIFDITKEQERFLSSTIPMTMWNENRTLIERVRKEGIYTEHERPVLQKIRKEYMDKWYGVPDEWWGEENPRESWNNNSKKVW